LKVKLAKVTPGTPQRAQLYSHAVYNFREKKQKSAESAPLHCSGSAAGMSD
jgi:hypothetical protein